MNTNDDIRTKVVDTYVGDPYPGQDGWKYWKYYERPQPSYGISAGPFNGESQTPKFMELRFSGQLSLCIDLPGVEQKDLKLTIEGNVLKVQYSRIDESTNRCVQHYVDPREFDVKNARATFHACVLKITFQAIPKPEQECFEIPIMEK